jgi:YVTN family beta-propeller protein
VTNEISGTVSEIDARTHELIQSVQIEDGTTKPVGIVVSPDGKSVYVACGGSGRVSVIDAANMVTRRTIAVGRRPWNLAITRDGQFLYVANGVSNDVSVVDLQLGTVVAAHTAGSRPWGVALLY